MKDKLEKNQAEFQNILGLLQKETGGKPIENIQAGLSPALDLRTLQRRLKSLIQSSLVKTTGQGRATKYTLVNQEEGIFVSPLIKMLLPLSKEGLKIAEIVSLPLQKREPAGYQRDFLESYQPNVSSYLTEAEKKKLAELGMTSKINAPAGTYAKEILQRLLIDLAWNSSRLEGNTYSLLDTQRLISDGVLANHKSATEAQMILNHKDAIEFIVQDSDDIGFNRYTILNLHALLSHNLLPNPAASGRLRNFGVGITQSVFTPLGVPQLIEEMFEMILHKAIQIDNPFEQAFFIMVQLPYLQPFDDVNKRVSRLAANIPLNRSNLAPLSFTEVPGELYIQGLLGIYELNRIELLKDVFLWAYERSAKQYAAQRQSLGEPDPFRLKYREPIRNLVIEIVANALSKAVSVGLIKEKSKQIVPEDQSKFVEAVETELINLHEGNFARYMIRPSEFKAWEQAWNQSG